MQTAIVLKLFCLAFHVPKCYIIFPSLGKLGNIFVTNYQSQETVFRGTIWRLANFPELPINLLIMT